MTKVLQEEKQLGALISELFELEMMRRSNVDEKQPRLIEIENIFKNKGLMDDEGAFINLSSELQEEVDKYM